MRFYLPSRISGYARPVLAGLAILAILGLAIPSASAGVSLSYTVNGGGSNALTSTVSSSGTAGSIGYTVTATSLDVSAGSGLTTTTIDINNTSSASKTITLVITGSGYSFAGTAYSGELVTSNYSVSGTGGPPYNNDTASVASTVAGTALGGTNTGSASGTGFSTTPYVFTTAATSPQTLTLAGSTFAITQTLSLTLNAAFTIGDQAQFTITTSATPVATPEPSTMAIAGIGALGMIGYGLRRRKAMGA